MGFDLESNDWEKLVEHLIKEKILNTPKIIKSMRSVPRSKFLPENMRSYSVVDTPLPIGFGQTISAPHNLDLIVRLGETWFQ
jgi:protein-L-isoaspartate(D-aspartate) O-methyltransferase